MKEGATFGEKLKKQRALYRHMKKKKEYSVPPIPPLLSFGRTIMPERIE
jgi:hypothetical protein